MINRILLNIFGYSVLLLYLCGMNKEFIPYEQSVALKELGFDEPCLKYWNGIGKYFDQKDWFDWNQSKPLSEYFVSVPLYQQAFRWFREVYGLHSNIISTNMWTTFSFYIDDIPNKNPIATHLDFNTPEEAELACLIKLIEIK